MKLTINFYPCLSERQHKVFVSGSVITIDGIDYDLSELPVNSTAEHAVLKAVNRSLDEYDVTIELGHAPNAPQETRFPHPIVLRDHNGPVELPAYDIAPEEKEEIVE